MTQIDDFFISSNSVCNISEEAYQNIDILISSFDAISRTTYQSLYIIDYYKKNFLYVSNNPLFLCGYTAEEVKEFGYMFYINQVPAEEQPMLAEINKAGFNFYNQLSICERIHYTISCDFHIMCNDRLVLVNHKLTPILLADDGKVWLAACVVALSSHNIPGHIELRKTGQMNFWEYSLDTHCWIKNEGIILSEKERNILSLSARGYTMNEISDKLFLAVDTIKFYKRRLFGKLEVRNITEALLFSENYKLL